MDSHLQIVAAAKDIPAEQILRLRLGDSLLQHLGAMDEFAADVDVGAVGIDGE